MTNAITTTTQADTATVRETAAAALLVVGRLAIAEWFANRGQDPDIMIRMHGEAVAAWADAWGCDASAVEAARNNFHASAQSLSNVKPDVHH